MSTVVNEKHVDEHPTLEKGHVAHHPGVDATDVAEPPRFGFRHPLFQIIVVSFICFACPGMFNALSGLGGGGQIDATTNDRGSTALYSTFAVMAFFGGSFVNKLGPRIALAIGTTGYTLYIASLLSYNINGDGKFNIAAGAILGICAGLLWTAEGVLMLAYATEAVKGRYIAIFWCIFNLGAVVGAAVPLSRNIHEKGAKPVANSIYIAFIIITALGGAMTLLLSPPSRVRRADGTRAVVPVSQSWIKEIVNVGRAMVTDPAIFLLFPFFAASNFFYTWQFSAYNLVLFNLRTRSLNNFIYWTAQIFGAGFMGLFLDTPKLSRKTRAIAGWAILFSIIMATWGGNYAIQKRSYFTREAFANKTVPLTDFDDSSYVGLAFLYIFNGVTDAAWQTYAYWLIGAMSNNARKLAVLVGIYKGLQSATSAVGWAVDSHKVEFMNIFAGTWGFLAAGMLIALPMVIYRVKEHTSTTSDELGGVNAEGNAAHETSSHSSHEK